MYFSTDVRTRKPQLCWFKGNHMVIKSEFFCIFLQMLKAPSVYFSTNVRTEESLSCAGSEEIVGNHKWNLKPFCESLRFAQFLSPQNGHQRCSTVCVGPFLVLHDCTQWANDDLEHYKDLLISSFCVHALVFANGIWRCVPNTSIRLHICSSYDAANVHLQMTFHYHQKFQLSFWSWCWTF